MSEHEGTATGTLDRIRTGGNMLLLTAQQRLGEIKRALDLGRFGEAALAAHSLHEKISHLAAAESSLGRLSDAYIVMVSDLEPGMVVVDLGEIVSIEGCPFCEEEACTNVCLRTAEGQAVLPGSAEIAVQR